VVDITHPGYLATANSILKWSGLTLILAGAVGVLLGGLLWLLSGWVGENATEIVQIYMRPVLVDLLIKALTQVVSQFAMVGSGIALLAGLAGGIIRYIFSAIHKAG